jgi:hypothetical protein
MQGAWGSSPASKAGLGSIPKANAFGGKPMPGSFRSIVRALVALCLGAALAPIPATAQAAAEARPGDAQSQREDIGVFRAEVLAQDQAYTPASRAEAATRLAALEQQAGAVSQAYFELELGRIVALADNAHTAFFPGPRSRRYNRVGVRLTPFGEDFFVLRATPALADLLGARLVAIEGRPIAELRTLARSLMGGLNASRDRNAGYFFESPEQLQALGVVSSGEQATYRFARPDGSLVERTLKPEPASEARPRANSDRWLYPAAMAAEADAWRALLSPAQAPWALQDPDTPFRWRSAPEMNAIVLELRQNEDAEGAPIAEALQEFTEAIKKHKPRHLIVDLRMNGGGDLNTTREFMRSLPALVPGRIFALTGPWTFSAGISSLGYLKQAAPQRVTLVGEPVGDRLQFFAEGALVQLPNSKALITIAKERHDYETGCKGFSDCHKPVVRHPIAVATLAPDLSAPWTIEHYHAGRDPALLAVAEALRR